MRTRRGTCCLSLVVGLLVLPGCQQRDRSCETPDEGLTARYVGQAYGYGTLVVRWNEETQKHRVVTEMMGADRAAVLRLEGEGACRDGVFRASLGGGRDETAGIRVLGGGLVVLFDHEPIPRVTGWWDVRVVEDKAGDVVSEVERLRGILEVVDPSDVPSG